jgi:hypothetical protein
MITQLETPGSSNRKFSTFKKVKTKHSAQIAPPEKPEEARVRGKITPELAIS